MIGVSAYGGLVDVTNPKPGETVVVSAAAGRDIRFVDIKILTDVKVQLVLWLGRLQR